MMPVEEMPLRLINKRIVRLRHFRGLHKNYLISLTY